MPQGMGNARAGPLKDRDEAGPGRADAARSTRVDRAEAATGMMRHD